MFPREEKQNKRDLFCPYLAPRIQKRRKRNGSSEQTNQNKKDLYRPYLALKDSKREETKWLSEKKTKRQPLFTISLCTKKTRQGAEIRRIFLQFSLPCERDRGNETATDLSSQKQKGYNGLRKIPIQPLLWTGSPIWIEIGSNQHQKPPRDLHFPQPKRGRADLLKEHKLVRVRFACSCAVAGSSIAARRARHLELLLRHIRRLPLPTHNMYPCRRFPAKAPHLREIYTVSPPRIYALT